MIDFGALPPDVNSTKMYAGPGSGPMMAAAAAWDGLAAELHSAAASYTSAISGLASGWQGPASSAMVAAATPYATWMSTSATQATQAGAQAKAAAAAHAAAFTMTVPPPVVAANRSLLASLVATNFLGQNTPSIAATEAHYGEMWAQDAAAMYGYAGSSAAATTLSPFAPAKQNTNPAGQAAQAAAVTQATGTSAATNAQSMMSAVPQALQSLASPVASTAAASPTSAAALASPASALSSLGNSSLASAGLEGITTGAVYIPSTLLPNMIGYLTGPGFNAAGGGSVGSGLGSLLAPGGALGNLGALGGISASGVSSVSAGLGQATTVGALSVPQTWAATGPAVTSAATALPGSSFSAIPANGAAGMPGMPMGGMGGMGGRFGGTGPRYGFKPIVMARPPAAGYGPIAL